MSVPSNRTSPQTIDWDALYRRGTPPWETGETAGELIRVLDEGLVAPARVLEVGCGTGADAAFLANRGFEVTAVELAPTALERARRRAAMDGAQVCFVLDDVFDFARHAGTFDFVYDAGFYHFVRQTELSRYLDLLWRVTQPGSQCLVLAGATGERAEGGPPQVSEQDIRFELGRLFQFRHLRPCRLESPHRKEGYRAWSCLMERPKKP